MSSPSYPLENLRSFAIIAHVDHGKTTLADSLVALGRLISEESAAHKRYLDSDKIEQRRGITILSAGVTIDHDAYRYFVIDSPGHADFSIEVSKGLRAVDGVLILVDIVEGLMPQGENVLRQALRQSAKMVLFINKIDRLFTELSCSLDDVRTRLRVLVDTLNQLVSGVIGDNPQYVQLFSFKKGNIIVGSGLYKYAVNPLVSSVTLTEVYQRYRLNQHHSLPEAAPLQAVLAQTINRVLPSPAVAQAYKFKDGGARYQALRNCDASGPVVAMVTNIRFDEQTRLVQIRMYSGTLLKGSTVYIDGVQSRVNRVCLMYGKHIKDVPEVSAGYICVIVLTGDRVQLGSTIAQQKDFPPFELIRYHAEPVISRSFTPVNQTDLIKLKELIKEACIQDNTLRYTFQSQHGEHILAGIGNLQLSTLLFDRIQQQRGIPLKLKPPTVIYRETITEASTEALTVTSNKLNKFTMAVEPLPPAVIDLLRQRNPIVKVQNYVDLLVSAGLSKDLAKRILHQEGTCLLFNDTKGVQFMQQTAPNIAIGFKNAVKAGPLAGKPVVGLGVRLTDAVFHVDFVHRTPADMAPPTQRLIHDRMLQAGPRVLEPYLRAQITTPAENLPALTRQITRRRGRIVDVAYSGQQITVSGSAPIRECDDLGEKLPGVLGGKLSWYYRIEGYQYLPQHLVAAIGEDGNKGDK